MSAAAPLADVITKKGAAEVYRLSERAIEGKMYRGEWLEGREYQRAPDGTIWIITKGVSAWVGQGRVSR